jgi:hypothetical protein
MPDLDLKAQGKMAGDLHLHHSTHDRAWQLIPIPVTWRSKGHDRWPAPFAAILAAGMRQ